jgi:hypothetical protein
MGRTTPSLKTAVEDYVRRFRRVSEILSSEDKIFIERFLEDLETTVSAYSHIGSTDPLEIFLIHLLRRIKILCKEAERK